MQENNQCRSKFGVAPLSFRERNIRHINVVAQDPYSVLKLWSPGDTMFDVAVVEIRSSRLNP